MLALSDGYVHPTGKPVNVTVGEDYSLLDGDDEEMPF